MTDEPLHALLPFSDVLLRAASARLEELGPDVLADLDVCSWMVQEQHDDP